jgi:hypothetical protein
VIEAATLPHSGFLLSVALYQQFELTVVTEFMEPVYNAISEDLIAQNGEFLMHTKCHETRPPIMIIML